MRASPWNAEAPTAHLAISHVRSTVIYHYRNTRLQFFKGKKKHFVIVNMDCTWKFTQAVHFLNPRATHTSPCSLITTSYHTRYFTFFWVITRPTFDKILLHDLRTTQQWSTQLPPLPTPSPADRARDKKKDCVFIASCHRTPGYIVYIRPVADVCL